MKANESNYCNILVVEDNPHIADLISYAVGSEPFWNVTSAPNGIDAVEMCRKDSYDLIVMDLRMPLMDGFEAIKEIRGLKKHKKHDEIKVIACSALTDEKTSEKCKAYGFHDFIAKPFELKELVGVLNKHIPKSKLYSYQNLYSPK